MDRSVAEVWAALTVGTHTWLGTWRREGHGGLRFTFDFEGEHLLPAEVHLDEVEVGRSALLSLCEPGLNPDSWRVHLQVRPHHEGTRTDVWVQVAVHRRAQAPVIASTCEYYLDRLMAVLAGEDPDLLDYDEYFLEQAAHYRRLFPAGRGPDRVPG